MSAFSIVFVVAVIANLTLQAWLAHRHVSHVRTHRERVPSAFAAEIPLSAHRKAADYTVARTRFGVLELGIGLALLLVWTLGGGLDLLDRAWRVTDWPLLGIGVAVMVSAMAIMGLLDLPLSAYRTFVIEQRFGFNRATPAIFLSDAAKQGLLLVLIGSPLAALVLWLMANAGEYWWLYVWLTWMGFSLLMMWAYPAFIAPLFNKFRPLDNESLRSRIETLLERNGFSSQGIFVMDGSTRSTHGNAYFTGLGANKRIVFFDTLLKELEPREIEAVLAHELGHFKRRHVVKLMAMMAAMSLAGLALLGYLIEQPWFYLGLGVSEPSLHTAMLLFLMVAPVFGSFLQPLMAKLSRKYEFEADAFAARQADARTLVQALVKLYKENANTLTPDPLFSAFHDSHPPAPVRIAHLQGQAG